MSDFIKHECAVTLLRLRRNPDYFLRKYGTPLYGYHKLALMLEKQHNRGQDGAGIAGISLNPVPGRPCYQLEKSARTMALADVLETIHGRQQNVAPGEEMPFGGELLLGHLRYGTYGGRGVESCHPFVRESARLNRTLLLAGNFNLTNTAHLMEILRRSGHHPAGTQDGYLLLQLLGHYWEEELRIVPSAFDPAAVLKRTLAEADGAFTLCGITGDGNAFAIRDAAGIRPGFFYFNDEVAVVASERPAIQAAFDCTSSEVSELPPGELLWIDSSGKIQFLPCLEARPKRSCVFERIYFSRGNDADIHRERKALGRELAKTLLKIGGDDWENTFYSYIPNTARICFHGMLEELCAHAAQQRSTVRFGEIAVKDAKFRTFIADAHARKEFFMHVYDVTYGLLRPGSDTLVVVDDSIVRGNTMRNAILPILDRLSPRRIIIASSAPPIRYPDCYGIDMASLKELVAFEAVIDLIEEAGKHDLLLECYENARSQLTDPKAELSNCVAPIYETFSEDQLSEAIARRLRPEGLRAELKIVYQSCEGLHRCCPEHRGDWYFTGNYPTPGGIRAVNQALVNFVEAVDKRAYQL